jgi:hypothetical protein
MTEGMASKVVKTDHTDVGERTTHTSFFRETLKETYPEAI